MKEDSAKFHPITKYSAAFGAAFCALAAVITLVDAILLLPVLNGVGIAVFKSLLMLYLAWCFWYAYRNSKNPFKVKPFSK